VIVVKFKGEIFMLLTAIALFAASAFLYSAPTATQGLTAASAEFPYQGYAFSFVGLGALLMAAASISFLKRSKPMYVVAPKRISAKNCAD
jgi:hypothetical protein